MTCLAARIHSSVQLQLICYNDDALCAGEKRKLKKEKQEAKRAARDARAGFDVRAARDKMLHFLDQEGDLLMCDPAGKHGQVGGASCRHELVLPLPGFAMCMISCFFPWSARHLVSCIWCEGSGRTKQASGMC